MRPHPSLLRLAAALLLTAASFAAHAAAAPAGGHVYTIDRNHSTVGFSIRHLVSRVEGRFKDFAGTVTYDARHPEAAAVDMTVQAASIDTGTDKRDEDLRSDSFFEVAKYPTLTFRSTTVKKGAGDTLDVTGDLTIHGVTKRVTVPVKVLGTMPYRGGEKAGFSTTFTIDRKDYGITWNRAVDNGGVLLGDDVEIEIQLETGWMPPAPEGAAAPAAAPTPTPKPGR
jgi:polyisoprenoid-binding protein YceI